MADRRHGQRTRIDLETVRETLVLMHDDMAGSVQLSRIRHALSAAIAEIDRTQPEVERERSPPLRLVTSAMPNFVPWTPGE